MRASAALAAAPLAAPAAARAQSSAWPAPSRTPAAALCARTHQPSSSQRAWCSCAHCFIIPQLTVHIYYQGHHLPNAVGAPHHMQTTTICVLDQCCCMRCHGGHYLPAARRRRGARGRGRCWRSAAARSPSAPLGLGGAAMEPDSLTGKPASTAGLCLQRGKNGYCLQRA